MTNSRNANTGSDLLQQLKLTNLFLEQSERAAKAGSFIINLDDRQLLWSRGMHSIYETDPDTFTPHADSIAPFDALERMFTLHDTTQDLGSRNRDYDAELELTTIKGKPLWVHVICKAETVNGQPTRLIGSVLDITERRKVEDALRDSEHFVHSSLDALLAHVAIVDETGTIIAVNAAWRLFAEANGVAPADVCEGVNYLACCDQAAGEHAEGAAAFAAGLRAVIKGEKEDYSQEYPCHSPYEKRWFIARVTCFSVHGTVNAVIAHENITQRKRTESALKQMNEDLRQLSENLTTIREHERTMMAREVHDELGQIFTALKLELMMFLQMSSAASGEIPPRMYAIMQMIESGIKSVQHISSSLRPRILDDLGLVSAIEWEAEQFQNRTGIPVRFTLPDDELKIDNDVATAIFRIVQESLTNILRHAEATRVSIELRATQSELAFTVRDNGKGIPEAKLVDSHSLGLIGIRERMRMLGGEIDIFNNADGGASIRGRLSLPQPISNE